jgi:sporulation protein YlmC with PRC-barrel domain
MVVSHDADWSHAMHSTTTTTPLVSMKSGEIELSDPNEDIRGRKVVDQNGEDVGKVDDVFVDPNQRRARFIAVKSGDFLGLGGKKFLIPVDAIQSLEEDRVMIGETRDRILGGPQIEGQFDAPSDAAEPSGAGGTGTGASTADVIRMPGAAAESGGDADEGGNADQDAPALVIAVYEWYDVDEPYWSPDYRGQHWA